MLIVIIALSIIGIGVAAWMFAHTELEWAPVSIMTACVIFLIISSITTIIFGISLSAGKFIDERIAMYEEENGNIELRVAESVNAYLEHESDILGEAFSKINPESAMTIVAAYPELRSSDLVVTQIEIYYDNNVKIKELKEEKIQLGVYRWWVYFG